MASWALVFLSLICLTPILALSKDTFSAVDDRHPFKQGEIREGRQKRDLGLAVSVYGLVFSVVTTFASAANDPTADIMAKLDAIKTQLRETNRKLDVLSGQVEAVLRSIDQNHDVTRIASVFADDLIRLNYFKLFFDNDAHYNDANQITLNRQSREWAEAVLSEGVGGMGPVLFNIHNMITGSTWLKPILDVYMNGLLAPVQPDIWTKMDRLIETLIAMQQLGYSMWGIAFDIAGRSNEKVTTVQRLLEDRFRVQQRYLVVDERLKVWPAGRYGLVRAAQGCPTGSWATGSRYHDTEDDGSNNGWSPSNIHSYISGSSNKNNMQWQFCMHREYSSAVQYWPSGKYCIFADSSTCPSAFSRGSLHFDDEDDDNANRRSGSVPRGSYDRNTRYDFCCRYDGSEQTEIVLPVARPFVLFPMHSYGCQRVKKMRVTELVFHWDCEDDDNANAREWPYPREDDQGRNMNIHMCYYTA